MPCSYIDEKNDVMIVDPEDLWDLIVACKEDLMEEPELLCTMNNGEIELYAEVDGSDDETPYIVVLINNDEVERLWISGRQDAEDTYKDVLMAYVDYETSRFYMEDAITEREDELNVAFDDLLCAILREIRVDDDIVEDVKEHTLKYIADKYPQCEVYRPMIIEDENGEQQYDEYPYETWDIE